MIGRYRSKFKQFDDNGNLLCYSCKEYKLQTVLIEILASGLEQKKILDVKSAKRKLTYVAKKKIEEVRI